MLPASTAAVALGLLMSTRLRRSADFRPLHENRSCVVIPEDAPVILADEVDLSRG